MDINTMVLNNIKVGDNDDELETTKHVRLVAWSNEYQQRKSLKNKQKNNASTIEFNKMEVLLPVRR